MDESLKEIFVRARQAEDGAVKEISERYGRPVYGFLSGLYGEEAPQKKKIMADAFADALGEYDPQTPGFGFPVFVMQHLIKALSAEVRTKKQPPPAGRDPRFVWLLEALGGLSRTQKILFLLRYQMDFLYEEIAWILGEPARNISHQLQKICGLFRRGLAEAVRKQYAHLPTNSKTNP